MASTEKIVVKNSDVLTKTAEKSVKEKVEMKTKDKKEALAQKKSKKSINAEANQSEVEKNPTLKSASADNTEPVFKPYVLNQSEEYMSQDQQSHFKALLNSWKTTLMIKINQAVSHLKDEPKHFADLNDRASQEEEFNLELKARDREADLVLDIDEALKRLHDGDYGYCEECGVEIGIRRLEARPTATLCIDCKTLAEMRERQAGG